MGYTIDYDNNYYVLNQGKINKNCNTTKKILLNNISSIPGLIVIKINEKDTKIYKVLNNHISFYEDKDFEKKIYNTGKDIYNYFGEVAKVNSIQIS